MAARKKAVADERFKDVIQELTESEVSIMAGDDDGTAVDVDAPLIPAVNQIIFDAFKCARRTSSGAARRSASVCAIALTGVMQEMKAPPKRFQPSINARFETSVGMSISEHRIPQDGRIRPRSARS